ncbi:hypothetical protein [Streptomyces alkaliterrae]|uniref:DUF8175 domain-containing protein n=1 Tax=Streptomyces alkaliterrae TaxID=2213162 RepID=A0A5P0YUY2_9ACTN|nr:hypothetical protein [Streptomyces alkaliterrae]MBB1261215.1 hypothetical protein [Streptomyces alkaliterrae]MQS04105.1 hypothetical protein [Streptomyces alkaliterrae]
MSFGGDDEYGHARSGRQGTRTRLPETESGAARSAPLRPGRNVLMVVGVVMLLIGAIAVATRAGEDDGRGGNSREQAQPTAPTGVKPVGSGADGIPAGFARTEQGAQSAAANYAVALVSAEIIRPSSRGGIIERVFAPDKVDDMRAKMDKAYSPHFLERVGLDPEGNAPKGHTYVSRTVPVGTKIVAFDSKSAELEVWCTGVYGMAGEGSTTPVTTDWFTMKFSLRWVGKDWKVQGFAQEKGPAPVNGDLRASTAKEIAEAVEGFGGFTYAR